MQDQIAQIKLNVVLANRLHTELIKGHNNKLC